MRLTLMFRSVLAIAFLLIASVSNAQIKYRSDGKLTIGNTEPEQFYGITTYGGGMYFKSKTSNFFQIDVTPAATRLASHYDQVVFYNTRLSRFNSIQVQNVYNYSDARAKTDIAKLNYGLSTVDKLNAVTYSFKDTDPAAASMFKTGGNGKEIGLLAQEVEQVLPNDFLTYNYVNKKINYTAIIPVMIQAIKELKAEVETLKAAK